MTETEKALIMQARCAFSRLVLMQANPIVSRTVAVPFNKAFTVGSASVKDIVLEQPEIQDEREQ